MPAPNTQDNGDFCNPEQALAAAREALSRYDRELIRGMRHDDERAMERADIAAEDLAQAFRRLDTLASDGRLPAAWVAAWRDTAGDYWDLETER